MVVHQVGIILPLLLLVLLVNPLVITGFTNSLPTYQHGTKTFLEETPFQQQQKQKQKQQTVGSRTHLCILKMRELSTNGGTGETNKNDDDNDEQMDKNEPSTSTSNSNKRKLVQTKSSLSPQELILQESLGITPETPKEREDRILQRQARINVQQTTKRMQNVIVAVLAMSAAILNYGYQFTHPITSLALLADMQKNSDDLTVIGTNGKPTVVDFWAPWCGNCKAAAPTLASIEEEYKSRINFVMVNGDLGDNWPIIERFGVDAIPHLAMVGADGQVETALIGPIPKGVLREDLNVMLENARMMQTATLSTTTTTTTPLDTIDIATGKSTSITPGKKDLPYVMFDAFQNAPEKRKITFKTEN